jgi:hypothetical protein
MRWLVLLAGATCVGGCDVVFGLDEAEAPCSTTSFATAKQTDLALADDFSMSWDRTFAVTTRSGFTYELALPSATETQFDLDVYTHEGFGLAPEGNALFYTQITEQPSLHAAVRSSPGSWREDPIVPLGVFAGTPSADELGPRRVIVRLHSDDQLFQEFEDVNGLWMPIGDTHTLPMYVAPNLTPNALTMVYHDVQSDGTGAVFAATRNTTADWFGDPVVILPGMNNGDHMSPQLLDRCHELYVIDSVPDASGSNISKLRRYAH